MNPPKEIFVNPKSVKFENVSGFFSTTKTLIHETKYHHNDVVKMLMARVISLENELEDANNHIMESIYD